MERKLHLLHLLLLAILPGPPDDPFPYLQEAKLLRLDEMPVFHADLLRRRKLPADEHFRQRHLLVHHSILYLDLRAQ